MAVSGHQPPPRGPHTRSAALAEGALGIRSLRQGLTLATLMATATAIGAQYAFYLPWNDRVPVTLQVHFVLLSGLLLGPRWALLSQAEYLAAGLSGAPVFAGFHAGLPALLGPSGGYLLGFLPAAWAVGRAAGPCPALPRALAACAAGVLLCYAFGVAWLLAGWRMGSDWQAALWSALSLGALPFLGVDLLKAVAACAIALPLGTRRGG